MEKESTNAANVNNWRTRGKGIWEFFVRFPQANLKWLINEKPQKCVCVYTHIYNLETSGTSTNIWKIVTIFNKQIKQGFFAKHFHLLLLSCCLRMTLMFSCFYASVFTFLLFPVEIQYCLSLNKLLKQEMHLSKKDWDVLATHSGRGWPSPLWNFFPGNEQALLKRENILRCWRFLESDHNGKSFIGCISFL